MNNKNLSRLSRDVNPSALFQLLMMRKNISIRLESGRCTLRSESVALAGPHIINRLLQAGLPGMDWLNEKDRLSRLRTAPKGKQQMLAIPFSNYFMEWGG